MEALALLVPAVATAALGGALLVPIRDGRAGRKATLDGRLPLLADFRNVRLTDAVRTLQEVRTPSVSDIPLKPGMDPVAEAIPTEVVATDEMPAPTPPAFDAIAIMRTVAKRLRARAPEPPTEEDVVTERSFADELSSLLPLPEVELEPSMMKIRDEPLPDRAEPHHDVATAIAPGARVVPLTRLPLRRQSRDVTWPTSASPPRSFASTAERHAFLRAAATQPELIDHALLALAFREETSEGRALALAALRRGNASKEAIETFTEALETGSDDERALAVDALSEAGARENIARGVTDRIDAIAATAALAYVGTTARDDYRLALAPIIDQSRIEAILVLLAGVVE